MGNLRNLGGLANLGGLGVAEDQPAHGGVHVHRLAGARDDAGETVVDADGGEASADAEDPGEVIDGRDHGVHADLRPTAPWERKFSERLSR